MESGRVDLGVSLSGRRRAAVAKVVFIGILVLHAIVLVRAESDPHKLFGFRPFNESDTWQAEIVRVTADGDRLAIDDGSWVYDWDELVGTAKLTGPGRTHHAAAGADAIVDFLDGSLEWTLENIPDDQVTVALEATVTIHRNTRGPEVIVLRSERSPDR